MRLLLGILFTLAFAAALGLGTTWLITTRGASLGGTTIGAWTAWPRTGTSDIDPFARAIIARAGELPLGLGDGVVFFAQHADSGRALDGRCDVSIAGTTPSARYWTLTLYDAEGKLVSNAVGRYGFTSREILRRNDGTFTITAAARARPGNWLPTSGVERYLLALRIYDTPVGVSTLTGRDVPMPSITAGACP
ncbi:MAG TPA: DUF1214 domain-containing protein [Woeseiaceae bacterium]|nr:DUF1214 domain-containing protein [Woeseiaceae bacterium]